MSIQTRCTRVSVEQKEPVLHSSDGQGKCKEGKCGGVGPDEGDALDRRDTATHVVAPRECRSCDEQFKSGSQLKIRVRKMNGETEMACIVNKLDSIYQLLECIYREWGISKSAQALHYEGTHSKKSELPRRVYTLDDKLVCLGDFISANEMGEELLFLLIQTERPEDTLRAARELLDRLARELLDPGRVVRFR